MAKRFADTEIWNKDWFLDLSLKQKLLVKYLFDNCDCAGVYEISYRNLKNCFGEEIKKEDFEGIKQVRFLDNGKIFIEDFIEFQYRVSIDGLNSANNVHKGILKILNKNNILTLNQPLGNPYPRVLDKDMVMDKEEDKDKEEGVLGGEENTPSNRDNINPDIYLVNNTAYFDTYKELCPDLSPVTFERRNKDFLALLMQFRKEIDDDVGKFRELCSKANRIKVIANTRLDFKMILNNYVGILNGKYEKNTGLEGAMNPDSFFKGVKVNDKG